ncbi:MAG: hydroxypyruvate isomerase family protein [Sneathiella sp.]|nr:hydroxypyruvate isomerase family protein [Sneathiella sp.]
MPLTLKFAANLSFLYSEIPFLDRFQAAAKDGFRGVEYLFPYDWEVKELKKRLDENGLTQVLFNLWPGDFATGERGIASLKGREADFRASLDQALAYAKALDCKRLHVMAGLRDEMMPYEAQMDIYRENLRLTAQECEKCGIAATIEPINSKDMPGYFLENVTMAARLIEEIGNPNLKLQFDIYHVQRTDGDICTQYRRVAPLVAHIQIANAPMRCEPNNGEINYPYIFDMLETEGYDGWIGCEYKPSTTTTATLGWAREYLSQ